MITVAQQGRYVTEVTSDSLVSHSNWPHHIVTRATALTCYNPAPACLMVDRPPNQSNTAPARPVPVRFLSLDVFRGSTIAMMILVNNPGDESTTYAPLQHAAWSGWTLTDLVFPFFLFIVGVAMTFSFSSRLRRGESRRELRRHVLWRGFVLIALGLFLNGFPNHYHLANFRVYGVLQRIALCYVISAILWLYFDCRVWGISALGCLGGYWVVMRFIPVPGCGVPGHAIPLLDPVRNLAAWLDRRILMGHLYDATSDPEGLLSTIPAVATSLLGMMTGEWLRSARSPRAKVLGLGLFGVAGILAGELCDLWFPINKKLWTSSYVIFTAGCALLCLAICYWVLDVRQWRRYWTFPFLAFGTNAIAAYIFSSMLSSALDSFRLRLPDATVLTWQEFLYQNFFANLAGPLNASLLYAIAFVIVSWAAMWLLKRKGIYLKI